MAQESIKNALRNFGLTQKELEIYLSLAKKGAMKTGQIAKQLKMNKGLTYRLLKNLEKKGVIEATLESPTRYFVIPFEKIIDKYVKSKREEAERIEEAKASLLSDWDRISQAELDSSLERFGVVEGTKKIYKKISEMVKEAEKQIIVGLNIDDLLNAERMGIFDEFQSATRRSNLRIRVLTELSKQGLHAIKIIDARLRSFLELRGINPSLGLTSFSRFVICDNEEIILFISEEERRSKEQNEVCLFTNCGSIIRAFSGFFTDSWKDAISIQEGILQIETGKPISQMLLIKDTNIAQRKFNDVLKKAENEILVVSSSACLLEFQNWLLPLKKRTNNGLSIKIMVPIIEKNLSIAQNLLHFCEVRHIPSSYIGTVIVDGMHLFQFKHQLKKSRWEIANFFNNTLYTNDAEYIAKTKNMLNDIWIKATIPSDYTIKSIFANTQNVTTKEVNGLIPLKNFRKVVTFSIENPEIPGNLTEKDVLDRILRSNRETKTKQHPEAKKMFASTGQAIIHPPDNFNLPSLMFHAFHIDKQSHLGARDTLVVFLWLETPSGFGFVPVAHLSTINLKKQGGRNIFKGTPAGDNFRHLSENKFYVRVHGNTLFSGWTKEIPLLSGKYTLPPSCFSLEGIGAVKTGRLSLAYQSGFKTWIEFNAFEALVTFFHPSSKYSGPGTDGILFREYAGESYLPK